MSNPRSEWRDTAFHLQNQPFWGSRNELFCRRSGGMSKIAKSIFRIFCGVGEKFRKNFFLVLIFSKKKIFQNFFPIPRKFRKIDIPKILDISPNRSLRCASQTPILRDVQNFRNIDFSKFSGGRKKILKKFFFSKN